MKIKETFDLAFQNHKKNNFLVAEKLYKEILKKQSNHYEAIFYLGTLSMQEEKFDKAKSWYEKAIKIKPNLPNAHNNLGIVFQKLGHFEKAKKCYKEAIKVNQNYPDAHNNHGALLQHLGDLEAAIVSYEKALKINPNYVSACNNLANVFNEIGDYKKAIDCCNKVIKINPNYSAAYNNLGNAFKKLKDNKNALASYLKAIDINPNYLSAYNNLGKLFRDLGKPNEAKKYFEKINTSSARGEHLECIYFSDSLNEYEKTLKKLVSVDPLNLRVATIATYVSKKENIKNIYPFCKQPLDFIFIKNIKNQLSLTNQFLENLLIKVNQVNSVWEPNSYATKGGFQTMGNLFNQNDSEILKLKTIVEEQILQYKDTYKVCEDFFIKKWPIKTKFHGWHVKLLKQGHQKSHIHPEGWLSGVFYLQVPKLLNENEGSIEFTLYGYDYPNHKNLPNYIHKPKIFDLVLFPSSLFHRTIPFSAKEERQSIAFDLIPE